MSIYIPDRKTVPKTRKSNILINPAHSRANGFARLPVGVELADHDIGRVRDDSAEDTGDVTTREGDAGLGALGVVLFRAWERGVDHFDDGLEGSELHHGVGDLTAPERIDTFVEAVIIS